MTKKLLHKRGLLRGLFVSALLMTASAAVQAELKVGVILSTTGPAASLGQPADNTIKLWPDEIAGEKVRIVQVNDNSDPTEAARLASKLVTEDKVDVIVGSSVTPPSIAIVETAGQLNTPIIALGGGNAIIEPQEGARTWAFKMPAPERLAVQRTLEHMEANQVKSAGVIAVSTSYGSGFLEAFNEQAAGHGIDIVGVERYGAQDLGVTSQILKLMAAQPDAIYIMSFGTPSYLPQAELVKRGYKGKIYQTHGVANADFLRVGGKDLEGTYLAVAPVLVAEQLPDDDPTKEAGLEYVTRYESKFGEGTRSLFGSTAWTALNWLEAAVPVALESASPGTPEFRAALRDALENMTEVVSPEGVFNMSKDDHNGIDERGQVIVVVEEGKWKLAE